MKKKIKFKIEYAPLSDDRINRHKNFDGLMAAYATTPKPNVFKRWFNNRYALFGGGLVVGITFSALMFWNNVVNDAKTESTNQVSTQQTTTSQPNAINSTAASTKSTETNTSDLTPVENRKEESYVVSTNAQANVATKPNVELRVENQRTTVSANASKNNSTAKQNDQAGAKTQDGNIAVEQGIETKQTVSELAAATAILKKQQRIDNEKGSGTTSPDRSEIQHRIPDSSNVSAAIKNDINSVNNLSTFNDAVIDTPLTAARRSDSLKVSTTDSMVLAIASEYKKLVNETAETVVEKFEKIDITNPLAKKDSTERSAVTTEDKNEKKKFKLFAQRNDETATDTFENHYAQVTFVSPLSTNGTNGARYLHYFSLNVLQGNTGALKGVEIGGLANLTKGYVYGAQFGGLINFVGGDVRGAQFGGLVNTSRSLQGIQFAGVTNVNQRTATGMQTAGVINLSIADSLFNGMQLAGAVNYNRGTLKGAQVSGAANVNLKQIDGGQVSGAFNVANKINGYQIGVINVANKMKGLQIGVINIADTMQGASIGLINVSRNGQFSVDIWGSDFLQVNGGLKVGNQRVYNVYAFGLSPFNNTAPPTDSLILKKSSLPFGFGLGLGANIPIRKAFINIDIMTWTIHDRYFDWRGINMLNQLRVTGGYRIHKYFGVYAGPVANVSIQDNTYAAFKDNALYEYNGSTKSVRGWLGFVAGIQLF